MKLDAEDRAHDSKNKSNGLAFNRELMPARREAPASIALL